MTMASSVAAPGDLFAQVLQPDHRANPYPFYARLREQPVSVQADGTYVVSSYREITLLLHDPRISSDLRNSSNPAQATAATAASGHTPEEPPLLVQDAPRHNQLRQAV